MPSVLSAVVAIVLLAPVALAGGRELAPRPLIAAHPRMGAHAAGEAGGRFLTAWVEGTELSGGRLMGALTDARGTSLGLAFPIASIPGAVGNSSLDVVGTGDSFAVFRTDLYGGGSSLIDVDLDGRVLGTHTLDLPRHNTIHAAWNGSRFLVVLSGNSWQNAAALLTRDGQIVDRDIPLLAGLVQDVLATPDRFLVLTAYFFNIQAVAADGSVSTVGIDEAVNAIRAAALPNGDVLVVSSNYDCELKARIWRDGAIAGEVVLDFTSSRPLAIVPGANRHVVAFARPAGGRSVLATLFVGNDGTPQSEVMATDVDVLPEQTSSAAANGARGLIAYRRNGIHGVVVERSGKVRAPVALSTGPAGQSAPILTAAGSAILGVWTEAGEDGMHIRAGVDGGSHEVLAGATPKAVAWNGSEALAVAQPRYGLVAVRLHADGSPAGPPIALFPDSPFRVAVAWAGDRWVIVWTQAIYLYVTTVTPDGRVADYRELRQAARAADPVALVGFADVALAFDGADLHLTWIEGVRNHMRVFTTRLAADGSPRDGHVLSLPAEWPERVVTAAGQGTLLAVIEEFDRTTVSAIGPSRAVSSRTLYDWPAQASVTWDGSAFHAAVRALGSRWYTALFRLDTGGNTIDARGIATLVPSDSGAVSVAALPAGGAFAGIQEYDTAGGARAAVYGEADLPALPQAPPTPNVRHVPGGIEWDGPADLWLVDTISPYGWRSRARTTEPRLQHGGNVRIRAFAGGVPSAPTPWIDLESPLRRRAARP